MAAPAVRSGQRESARERREGCATQLASEFAAVYEREYDPALRRARRLLKDRQAAEDAVEFVFGSYWKGYGESPPHVFRLDVPARVHAAILAAVRNRCISMRKGRIRFRKNTPAMRWSLIEDGRRGAPAPAAPTERELRITMAMAHALDGLTERRRNMFMAVKFDDQTYEEVAAKYGVTVSTVRQTVVKAYDLLRMAMVERSIQEEVLHLVLDSCVDDEADEYGEIDWTCTEEREDPET